MRVGSSPEDGEKPCETFRVNVSFWVWSEGYAGVLPDPQSLVQMRVVKDIPEKIDHLAIAPKLIRKHKLYSSQHEREKRVIAMQQRRLYRRGTHEYRVIARRPRHQEDCA